MPYGGTNSDQDARIERCVESLTKSGHDKTSAIRICKASVLASDRKKKGRK